MGLVWKEERLKGWGNKKAPQSVNDAGLKKIFGL